MISQYISYLFSYVKSWCGTFWPYLRKLWGKSGVRYFLQKNGPISLVPPGFNYSTIRYTVCVIVFVWKVMYVSDVSTYIYNIYVCVCVCVCSWCHYYHYCHSQCLQCHSGAGIEINILIFFTINHDYHSEHYRQTIQLNSIQ